APLPAGARVDE
ncbi:hypothetical protein W057_00536, partial [Mycobacterium tuberculosis TB_RSA147]